MTVHELRIKHNRFVEQLDSTVESIIDDNQQLLDLNREQLKTEHKDSKDKPIRPKYSRSYTQFKGFETPDLYLTGETHRTLQIEAKGNAYNVFGTSDVSPKLVDWYGEDIFGIAKSKLSIAKQITTEALSKIYRQLVFS